MYRIFLIVWVFFFLNGCAAMNKEECQTADWRTIGFEDGVDGERASKISSYRSACADYSVIPDLDRYTSGRQEGLKLYCTQENGHAVGLNGGRYSGVCSGDYAIVFLEGYNQGMVEYRLNQEINDLNNKIETEQERLHSLTQEVVNTENKLVHPKTTTEQRKALLIHLKELPNLISQTEQNINSMKLELKRLVWQQETSQTQYAP